MFIPDTPVPLNAKQQAAYNESLSRLPEIQAACEDPPKLAGDPKLQKILPDSWRVAYNLGIRYYLGKPCPHGHGRLRYVCSPKLKKVGVPVKCYVCSTTITDEQRQQRNSTRRKRVKARADDLRSARLAELEPVKDTIKRALAECWTEYDTTQPFPESPTEAKMVGVPIYRKKDATLWRVAPNGKSKSMKSQRWLREQEETLSAEVARCRPHLSKLKGLSPCKIAGDPELMKLLPVGAAAARALNFRYCLGVEGPCIHGHPPIRKVATQTGCVFCQKEYKMKAHKRKMANDPEYRERCAQRQRQNRRANLEQFRARELAWRQANPAKVKAKKIRRRNRERDATPDWLSDDQFDEMNQFYFEARAKTEETGELHQVDHIVPLQGENVCGLHVPWNLQVLTFAENMAKSNKWEGDPIVN